VEPTGRHHRTGDDVDDAPPTAAPEADPPMDGMATRRDVVHLAVTRDPSADLQFCRLTLPHHLGGLT
jgi:hypothetical protein